MPDEVVFNISEEMFQTLAGFQQEIEEEELARQPDDTEPSEAIAEFLERCLHKNLKTR